MREYLRIAFTRLPIGVQGKHPFTLFIYELIGFPERWRLAPHFYSFPFELGLKDAANRYFPAPKAKVDAHKLEPEDVTC